MSKKRRLTPEQEAIRLRGLRILARMIVRAHLDAPLRDCSDSGGERCGDGAGDSARGGPREDGRHVR